MVASFFGAYSLDNWFSGLYTFVIIMLKRRTCNTVEAKAKLSELLNEVSQGSEVVIHRRGKVVAKLVPASGAALDTKEETVRFMKGLREFQKELRKRHGPDSMTVSLLRELRRES